jgi:NADP-dependent 3-hydroxy acid dehydrogenase YdfG
MTLQDAFSLTDKVAIVTGAGRGIGAQTAKTYAEAGADLVLAARTKEQLDAIADEVRGFGRRALVIPCDANDNEALEDVVAQTMAEFGRIDAVQPHADVAAVHAHGEGVAVGDADHLAIQIGERGLRDAGAQRHDEDPVTHHTVPVFCVD